MMRPFSLAEAGAWLGVPVSDTSLTFSGVSTDTRTLQPGNLYVALRGERFDGHQFLMAALDAGAVAAIVDTPDAQVALPQIQVADTLRALGTLASANRNESSARFLAVTGSSGKTTVKEMMAAMVAGAGKTLSTRGNLNNHIGVPLTLFGIGPEHRYGVIELGASGVGEIAVTVAMVRPRVAVITNAGEAHLEGFGSYDNIVLAKGEIIDGVDADGFVVLNADDPAFDRWKVRAGQRQVISISLDASAGADYACVAVTMKDGQQLLTVAGPGGWQCELALPLLGRHNITNALLAVAAVRSEGLSDDLVQQGLAGLQPIPGRLQAVVLQPGLTLIDDSYNANPSAMKAALEVLADFPGERVAVLGAMAELGVEAERLHEDVGEFARKLGIERLVTVGPGCQGYRTGYGAGAEAFADHDQAIDRLTHQPSAPLTWLVKGSRSSAMDVVAEGIKQRIKSTCCSG